MGKPVRSEPPLWVGLVVPLVFFGAIAMTFVVIRARPGWLLGVVLGALVLLAVGWVVVSALWPARANRTCPGCGEDSLVRMDPHEVRGLRCTSCGWEDPTASAWLLAEDEEIVLEDLVRPRRPRG